MKGLKYVFIFLAGAGVGALVTNKLVADKYKKIADEEIESVKEVFNKEHRCENKENTVKQSMVNSIIKECEELEQEENEEIIDEMEYASDDDEDPDLLYDEPDKSNDEVIEPYTIAPEEYGEMPGYDQKTLYYYADKLLAYSDGVLVTDPIELIGKIKLEGAFGEYSDDGVYVRNDNLKCDYEILLSLKTYSEDTGNLIEE